jgi:hypothetical protein
VQPTVVLFRDTPASRVPPDIKRYPPCRPTLRARRSLRVKGRGFRPLFVSDIFCRVSLVTTRRRSQSEPYDDPTLIKEPRHWIGAPSCHGRYGRAGSAGVAGATGAVEAGGLVSGREDTGALVVWPVVVTGSLDAVMLPR